MTPGLLEHLASSNGEQRSAASGRWPHSQAGVQSDGQACQPPVPSSLPNPPSCAARVQLHACRSAAGGSTADYDTIAAADIPLACLLSSEQMRGASEVHGDAAAEQGAALILPPHRRCPAGEARPAVYQQVTLLAPDGTACGSLKYALAALRPLRCHPAAGPLTAAAQPQPTSPAPRGAQAAQGNSQAPLQLIVDVVRCRDLRSSSGEASGLQPYVALMLPQRGGRPPLLFESRPAAGSSPEFQQQAAFSVGEQAAGAELEAVVFDAAAGADAQHSIIGVARIPLPPGGSESAGGAAQLHPLLHPISGRHAGALELGLRWG